MPGTDFVRNHWYIAAHSYELAEAPVDRTICGEPIVLFRGADGIAVALSDRCPHRFAPLSAGMIVDGDIQCGYHGIRFGYEGRCTFIPGGQDPPDTFRARNYQTTERHGFVWIWMGKKPSDENLIPNFHENEHPDWTPVPGYLLVEANFELIVDNLLDLTHVAFVHKTTLAGTGVPDAPLEVNEESGRVTANRVMYNVEPSEMFRVTRGLEGRIDRWQYFEFYPPCYVHIILGAREVGSDMRIGDPTHVVLNGITPESEITSHYFWSTSRPWGHNDTELDQKFESLTLTAFMEDKSIIERQQALILSNPETNQLVSLNFDRAGRAARRLVEELRRADT